MIFVMMSDKYKTWKYNTSANVVLLAEPTSGSQIVSDMFSHMITFLYAPYRLWPSATPLATATSGATKEAATPAK
jgi:hypothetical protein